MDLTFGFLGSFRDEQLLSRALGGFEIRGLGYCGVGLQFYRKSKDFGFVGWGIRLLCYKCSQTCFRRLFLIPLNERNFENSDILRLSETRRPVIVV